MTRTEALKIVAARNAGEAVSASDLEEAAIALIPRPRRKVKLRKIATLVQERIDTSLASRCKAEIDALRAQHPGLEEHVREQLRGEVRA